MECHFKVVDNHNIIVEKIIQNNIHYKDIIQEITPNEQHNNHYRINYFLKYFKWKNPYLVSKDEVSSESQNGTEYDIINNDNDFKKALNEYNKSFIDRRECIILRSIDNIMLLINNNTNNNEVDEKITEGLKELRNITMPLEDLKHVPIKIIQLLKNVIMKKSDEAKVTAIIIMQQISRNVSLFIDEIINTRILDSMFTFSAPFIKQMEEKSGDQSISALQLHLVHLLEENLAIFIARLTER